VPSGSEKPLLVKEVIETGGGRWKPAATAGYALVPPGTARNGCVIGTVGLPLRSSVGRRLVPAPVRS